MPFSTAGMYSLGTLPPLTSLTNSKPVPGGRGSQVRQTRGKAPLPPARRQGLAGESDAGEVALAARLTLQLLVDLGLRGRGLAVGHLGTADLRGDAVLALERVDPDFQGHVP